MGLILPQTVKIKISKRICKYYREKGYEFEKYGDIIEVNVLDLPKGSGIKVKIICDVCGKEKETCYGDVAKCNEKNELITCGSDSCKRKKTEDTCIKKYGVRYLLQSKEIQDKIKITLKEKYGENIVNIGQVQEIKEKIKNTNLEKYGHACSLQSEEIRNKGIQTLKEKYGENIVNAGQVKEIQDKVKKTWQENYGENITHPMQVEEIKNKALDSFQFNRTGPSSRAQRYINHILNGILNKHICGSLADIYIEKENIIIEHDGSGHFLRDKINKEKGPTKESLLHEKEREDKIINNGYRMIRFIAAKDRIPSDEVILNLIEEFKNSDFKVIRINFEESTIEKDYNEKWHCNFGELRNITKEDLKQFESKKTINLK